MIRDSERYCKCGHNRQKHRHVTRKAISCTPDRCHETYRMGTFHHCRYEHIVGLTCMVDGCECKVVRPESNLERKERLSQISILRI